MSTADLWVTFSLDGEMFALRVDDVTELRLDLGGSRLPAIDVRDRLGLPPRGAQRANVIVLPTACLVVDDIDDVVALPTARWGELPATLAAQRRAFVLGACPLATHLVLALDTARLVGA